MSVVILHGWGHNKEMWNYLASQLGEECIAIDLPGFGKEPLLNPNWTLSDYADWVQNKINSEQNLIILGHSFGGRVAVEVASRQPKNLVALILSGAPCIYRPTRSLKLKKDVYKLFKNVIPPFVKKHFYSTDFKNAGALTQIFKNVVSTDQTTSLKKIKIKTLLLWGEKDLDVPLTIATEMKTLIANSELKVMDDCGHNAFVDNPNLFYGYVKKFISNL